MVAVPVFDHAQNDRLRVRLKALLQDEYGGVQADLARALKMTPASLHGILNGGGASYATVLQVAELVGAPSVDALLGPRSPQQRPHGLPPAAADAIGDRKLRASTLAAVRASAHMNLSVTGWRAFINGLEFAAETAEAMAAVAGGPPAAALPPERAAPLAGDDDAVAAAIVAKASSGRSAAEAIKAAAREASASNAKTAANRKIAKERARIRTENARRAREKDAPPPPASSPSAKVRRRAG